MTSNPVDLESVAQSPLEPARTAERKGPTREHIAEGAILVADASGFSRLAESAAADPDRGAERIAELLQRRFEPVVRRCTAHGGLVVCFPGDAALVFFPTTSTSDDALDRAAAAARELLRDAESLEGPRLRCGVAAGAIRILELGARPGRRYFVLDGDPVRDAFRLHSEAAEGEVRVGRIPPRTTTDLRRIVRSEASSFEFVQDASLRSLIDIRPSMVAELRRVTTVFARIADWSESTTTTVDRIADAFAAVERAIDVNGGSLVQTLFDEGGLTVMACWGLPGSTYEDDVPRALDGATDMARSLGRFGFGSSIGVATGRTFAGARGGGDRLEYAPIGHAVNVAARLMQLGEPGVRIDEATAADAGRHWTVTELEIRRLSKLEHASRIFTVTPSHAIVDTAGAMYGREFECAQIDDAISAIGIRPNAPRLGFEAAAGMGKSLLARYARGMLDVRGVRVVSIAGRERGSDAPEISLASLFSDPATGDVAGELTRMLANESRLLDWIPAFLGVLDPRVGETDITRQMDPEQRRHVARRIFASLLASLCAQRPCALLVDDAHGLDEATEDLVLHALRTVPALGAFFFGRREESGRGPWTSRAPSVDLAIHRLRGIDDEAVAALVRSLLGPARTTPELVQSIARRCDGNPLFVRHIALSMRDSTRPPVAETGLFESTHAVPKSLPPTIEATISARIDRLPTSARHAIKLAAVLGREFEESTLAAMDSDVASDLEPVLERLESRGVLVRDTRTKRSRFEHAMTREVAYNLLLDSQRRDLHGRAARCFTGGDATAATRAYHRVRSDAPWEAVDDLDELGREAIRRHANFEALGYLEQADMLSIAHRDRLATTPDEERLRATLRAALIAEAAHKLGRHEHAMDLGRRAGSTVGVTFADSPAAKTATVVRALATHVRARRAGPRPLPSGLDDTTREARLTRAAATAFYWASLSAFNHNHVGSYVLFNVLTLNLTEGRTPVRERALALAVMGITAGLGGLHGVAERYGRDAIALADELDDELARAHVRMFDSIRLGALGRFAALDEACIPAIPIADRYGDLRLAAELRSLRALSAQHRGELDEARALWGEALALAKESSDPTVENWGRCGLVEVELRRAEAPDVAFCERELEAARTAAANLGVEESVRSIGLSAWLAGRVDTRARADVAIGVALDALDTLPVPNAFWSLDGMSGPMLALAALVSRGLVERFTDDERALASRASATLGRYARVFPIGRARASIGAMLDARAHRPRWLAELELGRARRAAFDSGLDLEARLVTTLERRFRMD